MRNSAITTMKPPALAAGFVDCVEKRHGTQASSESPPPVPIPAERTCVRCRQVRSGIAPSFSSDYPGRLHPCAVGVHGRFLLVFGQRQCPSELRSAIKATPLVPLPGSNCRTRTQTNGTNHRKQTLHRHSKQCAYYRELLPAHRHFPPTTGAPKTEMKSVCPPNGTC